MKKTRKRLFAFSGLFVLVAQVLVMALCSIPAIAVTREETNRTLFNNEHGSATISYEEMESGGLNWTINLQKAAHDTATRFMVAMTADGQAIMPENVQTVMQSAPEISFTAGNGEGLMLAGLQEGAAGSGAGSAVITYQTSGNYGQMAVVPKLVTVGDTVSDLLAGNPGVVYNIPVKEEPAATEEAVTGELLLNDGQTATTETTEADAVESTTDSQDAEITESTTESTATDEATEVTETTESSDAVVEGEVGESDIEDSTEATESSSEATDNLDAEEETDKSVVYANPVVRDSGYTALRFEKTWKDVPNDAPSIEIQIKRHVVGSDEWSVYATYEYSPADATNGVTIDEWHNLPINDEMGGPYEYTLVEVPNPYYTTVQGDTVASQIDSVQKVTSNKNPTWSYETPGFIIASIKGKYFIWTVDPVDSKEAFLESMKTPQGGVDGPGNSYEKFIEEATLYNTVWATGDFSSSEYGISTEVNYEEDGDYTTQITFSSKDLWTQFFYGGHTTKMVPITNTYVEPKTVTVKKIWDDQNNRFGKRQDVDLILEQSPVDKNSWKPVDPEQKLHVSAGDEGNEFSQDFILPAQGLNDDGNIVSLKYHVVEKLADGSDAPVPGYENPIYSPDLNTGVSANGGTLTVTNKLITTDLAFTKVKSNGDSLDGVTFVVSQGDNEIDTVISGEDSTPGHVSFEGLAVGEYTLTETATVNGYQIDGPWNFTVNADKSITWTGENPFGDQNITNNGKIVNNLKPFDLTVNKVDDQKNPLVGATFELTDKDGNKLPDAVLENDGSSFVFKDLKPGTYTLTETKAPDGYAKLLNPITITISEDGTVTVEGKDNPVWDSDSKVVDGNNTITITVANKKLVPLPATGGPGTLLFFVMGIMAIAVTGIYFVSRQKQEVA